MKCAKGTTATPSGSNLRSPLRWACYSRPTQIKRSFRLFHADLDPVKFQSSQHPFAADWATFDLRSALSTCQYMSTLVEGCGHVPAVADLAKALVFIGDSATEDEAP